MKIASCIEPGFDRRERRISTRNMRLRNGGVFCANNGLWLGLLDDAAHRSQIGPKFVDRLLPFGRVALRRLFYYPNELFRPRLIAASRGQRIDRMVRIKTRRFACEKRISAFSE